MAPDDRTPSLMADSAWEMTPDTFFLPLPDSGLKDLVILRRRRLSRLTLDRIMGQRDEACPLAAFFHKGSSTHVFPKS